MQPGKTKTEIGATRPKTANKGKEVTNIYAKIW